MVTPLPKRRRVLINGSEFWSLATTAAFLLFAFQPLVEWWRLGRLLDHGVLAPATITSTSIDVSGKYSVDVVHYEFQSRDGTDQFVGLERFSNGPSPDLEPGELAGKFYKGALKARFLPGEPQVHRLDLGLPRRMNRSGWNAFLLIILAGVVGLFGVWRLIRRRTSVNA
jgi:hypothetical protein